MTDTGILDTVWHNFVTAISSTWGPSLSTYLLPLLMGIIVLQFGLLAVEAAISRDLPLLLVHMLLGIIRIGIVVAIFQHAFEWGNDIVQTGQVLGNNISGVSLTPSGIFDAGLGVAKTIWHTKALGAWYMQPFEKLEFFLIGLAVMSCWFIASMVYLGVLVEDALLVYCGPLVIAFTPLSWTFDMLLVWAKSLLGLAFKLALVVLTLAVGMTLAYQWIATTNSTAATFTTNMWNLVIVVPEAGLFAYVVWKFPNRISGLTAGGASIGFGEALLGLAGTGASTAYSALRGNNSQSSSAAGGGSGGATSEGGGSQSAQATAKTAKVLAQKVQSKLTS